MLPEPCPTVEVVPNFGVLVAVEREGEEKDLGFDLGEPLGDAGLKSLVSVVPFGVKTLGRVLAFGLNADAHEMVGRFPDTLGVVEPKMVDLLGPVPNGALVDCRLAMGDIDAKAENPAYERTSVRFYCKGQSTSQGPKNLETYKLRYWGGSSSRLRIRGRLGRLHLRVFFDNSRLHRTFVVLQSFLEGPGRGPWGTVASLALEGFLGAIHFNRPLSIGPSGLPGAVHFVGRSAIICTTHGLNHGGRLVLNTFHGRRFGHFDGHVASGWLG